MWLNHPDYKDWEALDARSCPPRNAFNAKRPVGCNMYGKEVGECILSVDTRYNPETKDINPLWLHPQQHGFSITASSRWHKIHYSMHDRGWMTGRQAWELIRNSKGKLIGKHFRRCPDRGRPDFNFLIYKLGVVTSAARKELYEEEEKILYKTNIGFPYQKSKHHQINHHPPSSQIRT